MYSLHPWARPPSWSCHPTGPRPWAARSAFTRWYSSWACGCAFPKGIGGADGPPLIGAHAARTTTAAVAASNEIRRIERMPRYRHGAGTAEAELGGIPQERAKSLQQAVDAGAVEGHAAVDDDVLA